MQHGTLVLPPTPTHSRLWYIVCKYRMAQLTCKLMWNVMQLRWNEGVIKCIQYHNRNSDLQKKHDMQYHNRNSELQTKHVTLFQS